MDSFTDHDVGLAPHVRRVTLEGRWSRAMDVKSMILGLKIEFLSTPNTILPVVDLDGFVIDIQTRRVISLKPLGNAGWKSYNLRGDDAMSDMEAKRTYWKTFDQTPRKLYSSATTISPSPTKQRLFPPSPDSENDDCSRSWGSSGTGRAYNLENDDVFQIPNVISDLSYSSYDLSISMPQHRPSTLDLNMPEISMTRIERANEREKPPVFEHETLAKETKEPLLNKVVSKYGDEGVYERNDKESEYSGEETMDLPSPSASSQLSMPWVSADELALRDQSTCLHRIEDGVEHTAAFFEDPALEIVDSVLTISMPEAVTTGRLCFEVTIRLDLISSVTEQPQMTKTDIPEGESLGIPWRIIYEPSGGCNWVPKLFSLLPMGSKQQEEYQLQEKKPTARTDPKKLISFDDDSRNVMLTKFGRTKKIGRVKSQLNIGFIGILSWWLYTALLQLWDMLKTKPTSKSYRRKERSGQSMLQLMIRILVLAGLFLTGYQLSVLVFFTFRPHQEIPISRDDTGVVKRDSKVVDDPHPSQYPMTPTDVRNVEKQFKTADIKPPRVDEGDSEEIMEMMTPTISWIHIDQVMVEEPATNDPSRSWDPSYAALGASPEPGQAPKQSTAHTGKMRGFRDRIDAGLGWRPLGLSNASRLSLPSRTSLPSKYRTPLSTLSSELLNPAPSASSTFRGFSTSSNMSSSFDSKSPKGNPHPIPSMATQTRSPGPDTYQLAMARNTIWASKTVAEQPELFPKLASGQHPEILWIGCSDSRCPETTVLGLQPGDIFVHRNIANVIQYNDISSATVIEFAVVYLKVKHIIICGHTSCGGISAALANKKLGLLDTWLMPLRRLREQNMDTLQHLDLKDAAVKLAEINVLQGMRILKENSAVLDAIQERGLKLHGVIYDVASGKLRELECDEPLDVISKRIASFKTVKDD
ncbi:hypothetical protein FQN57_002473 [Myotisia sp. PD_48]|nr:hypothetical protein FQN57_002473 [Myotisia sp. PD_48]